jgi:hypothetical protein
VEEHILAMLQKTMDKLILFYLSICATTHVTFDFWMFHIGFDTLHQLSISLMMHEILSMLLLVFFKPPTSMIIGEITLINIVKLLLAQFKLTHIVLAYVQTKVQVNLNKSLAFALFIMFNYESLELKTPFVRNCFGHAMFKACQYVTNDYNVCVWSKGAFIEGCSTNYSRKQ